MSTTRCPGRSPRPRGCANGCPRNSMATNRYARRPPPWISSGADTPAAPARPRLAYPEHSGAIEDARETGLVRTLVNERQAQLGERGGQRKDIASHQQVGIVSSNRIPVDAAVG